MAKDAIVEEVRRIRQAYAARFNYDVAAIFRDLQERQERGEFLPLCVVNRDARIYRLQLIGGGQCDQSNSAIETDAKTRAGARSGMWTVSVHFPHSRPGPGPLRSGQLKRRRRG